MIRLECYGEDEKKGIAISGTCFETPITLKMGSSLFPTDLFKTPQNIVHCMKSFLNTCGVPDRILNQIVVSDVAVVADSLATSDLKKEIDKIDRQLKAVVKARVNAEKEKAALIKKHKSRRYDDED